TRTRSPAKDSSTAASPAGSRRYRHTGSGLRRHYGTGPARSLRSLAPQAASGRSRAWTRDLIPRAYWADTAETTSAWPRVAGTSLDDCPVDLVTRVAWVPAVGVGSPKPPTERRYPEPHLRTRRLS